MIEGSILALVLASLACCRPALLPTFPMVWQPASLPTLHVLPMLRH